MKGKGCKKCGEERQRIDLEKLIKQFKDKHRDKYDYSLVEYVNNVTSIKIVCPIHGVFEQKPVHHKMVCGCQICNESKGEKEITNILCDNNIKHIKQKTFDNCKNKHKLPFDFYLPDYNICIEFDGRQHFESVLDFGGDEQLKKTQQNDKIKNNYCKENNIKLLRIKYSDDINKNLLHQLI